MLNLQADNFTRGQELTTGPTGKHVPELYVNIECMTADEREKLREWVENWKTTGPFLEELRREKIRNSDIRTVLPLFDGALRSALWRNPARPTSGLVQFHRILAKTR